MALRMPPPRLGEHSLAVLSELGYSGEDVDALLRAQVVAVDRGPGVRAREAADVPA